MTVPNEKQLNDLVEAIDELLADHMYMGPHNLAGVLLSRVVLLTEQEPQLGKDLVRYVWEKLDDIEQNSPSGGSYDF